MWRRRKQNRDDRPDHRVGVDPKQTTDCPTPSQARRSCRVHVDEQDDNDCHR